MSIMKGSHGISGAIWPLFFTAFYYLIFNGIVTLMLGRLEHKLEYFCWRGAVSEYVNHEGFAWDFRSYLAD